MTPAKAAPMREDVTRFWAKVDVRNDDECWLWNAARSSTGYGRVMFNGVMQPATRIAWQLRHNEPFPEGKFACHTCDNPPCVNPAHIWPGTQQENILDCVAKGRHGSKPMKSCKRGHPMADGNRVPTTGGYRCRACENERARVGMANIRNRRKAASNG